MFISVDKKQPIWKTRYDMNECRASSLGPPLSIPRQTRT